MPESEFEIYLSAVSRLLRLNADQKAAISDELRDHLEERLGELTESGQDRDAAIRNALDEFGDASGLAVEFTRVAQSKLRRVIVQTAAVTAVFLIVANVLINMFLPRGQQPAEPINDFLVELGGKPAQADDSRQVNSKKPGVSNAKTPKEPKQIETEPLMPNELRQSVGSIEFQDVPLPDVIRLLAKAHKIPIVIDQVAFSDEGIELTLPITDHVRPLPKKEWDKLDEAAREKFLREHPDRSVQLAQFLDRILHPHSLEWHVEDNVVVVTTEEIAGDTFLTRLWPVADLLESGMTETTLNETLMFMTTGPWIESVGAGGAMQLVGGILNVRQTFQMQRQIEQLLPALRHRENGTSVLMYPDNYWAIRRGLDVEVAEVAFQETSLVDVIKFLSDATAIDIRIDKVSLEEEGILTRKCLSSRCR